MPSNGGALALLICRDFSKVPSAMCCSVVLGFLPFITLFLDLSKIANFASIYVLVGAGCAHKHKDLFHWPLG